MNKIKNLEKYLNKLKDKLSNTNNLYKYTYLKKEGNKYIEDENYKNLYGDSRIGYKKWQTKNIDKKVEYSGVESFRRVYDKNNNEIGAFIEKTIRKSELIDEKKELNFLINKFVESFGIKDLKSFQAYIDDNLGKYLEIRDPIIESYIMLFEDILYEYKNNENFKIFFDKIIK